MGKMSRHSPRCRLSANFCSPPYHHFAISSTLKEHFFLSLFKSGLGSPFSLIGIVTLVSIQIKMKIKTHDTHDKMGTMCGRSDDTDGTD